MIKESNKINLLIIIFIHCNPFKVEVEFVSFLGFDQPVTAQVVSITVVADRSRRWRQDASHCCITNPSTTRHSWIKKNNILSFSTFTSSLLLNSLVFVNQFLCTNQRSEAQACSTEAASCWHTSPPHGLGSGNLDCSGSAPGLRDGCLSLSLRHL